MFSTVVASFGGALDGMTFTGTVTEEGKKKGDKDSLVFADGQFVSEACVPYGFGKAAYSAKKEKTGTAWHSEVPSSKHNGEKLVWDGVVTGKSVTGTMVWVKSNGKKINYTVKAEKK